MDVNAINGKQEYTNSYNTLDSTKNFNTVTNEQSSVKSTMPDKKSENQDLLNQDPSKLKKEDIESAIKKINKSLEDEKVHAEYSVHKELGTLMIKIVEDDTKKVVLELPPEKILNMIAFICKQDGLFDKKV